MNLFICTEVQMDGECMRRDCYCSEDDDEFEDEEEEEDS